ncbi:MAG: F0F1 ATP synthase subunit B [Prochlorococcaceae cyanobacterium]
MLVDWFIVVAQIINFLILMGLLRWFLYKPVLSVMGKRKAAIQRDWQEARQRQEEAEAELAEHRRLREQLEAEKQDWLDEARKEVQEERRRTVEQMRHDLQEQRQRWREDLERERESTLERIGARLLDQVQALARRALADLASVDLEDQVIARFLDRLEQLEPERREALLGALKQDGGGARLRTGFGVGDDRREELRRRLAACLPPLDTEGLVFEQEPELLCGIELSTGTETIGWTLDAYLTDLEASLSEAVSGAPGDDVVRAGGG